MNRPAPRSLAAVLFALAFGAGACASSQSTTANEPTASERSSLPAPASDEEIVADLAASDRGEIEQGGLAQSQASGAEVRAFGQSMVSMHTDASARMSALAQRLSITPRDNETSRRVTDEAGDTRRRLAAMSGADFDRAYMDAQVTMHSHVLAMLDQSLIPHASNTELRAALQNDVRPMVASHLQQARDLRGRLP